MGLWVAGESCSSFESFLWEHISATSQRMMKQSEESWPTLSKRRKSVYLILCWEEAMEGRRVFLLAFLLWSEVLSSWQLPVSQSALTHWSVPEIGCKGNIFHLLCSNWRESSANRGTISNRHLGVRYQSPFGSQGSCRLKPLEHEERKCHFSNSASAFSFYVQFMLPGQ